ncbi:MAG: hypothetical protein LBI44_04370 [Oscillospiraceae bacterium]|jgi:uncharacterized protein (UPF0305 family)|nr:hypothetical protein [Oscillospiraceae bacterium]
MNERVRLILEHVKSAAHSAGEAAGRTWDSAKTKTGEIWEVTKLNLHISDLQQRITETYQDIGELVYRAHREPNTDTEAVDDLLASIDELNESAQQLRERVAELKQIRYCPGCDKQLNREDEYCRFCGRKL